MDNSRETLHPVTDEQLLAAHVAGDRLAFAGLVHRHERDLHRFLRRFVGDAVAADDLFQETCLQIHQSARKFDPQKRFRPWLFTIAANKARDLLRSRRRRRAVSLNKSIDGDGTSTLIDVMPTAHAGPLDLAETADTRRRVNATVAALPAIYRDVLRLAYLHDMPYRQIGKELGVPLGTVKSRLHVAVKAFAAAWAVAGSDAIDPRRN